MLQCDVRSLIVALQPSACKRQHIVYEGHGTTAPCYSTQRPLVDAKVHQTEFKHNAALS